MDKQRGFVVLNSFEVVVVAEKDWTESPIRQFPSDPSLLVPAVAARATGSRSLGF